MHVLAHPHAPQNHGALGGGVGPRHFAQGVCRNAANGCHGFRRIRLHVGHQCVVVVDALRNEFGVHQALLHDHMQQGVEHGHVGVGLEIEHPPSVPPDVGPPWVGQHNARAPLGSVFHPGGGHRVIGRGVGANHQNQFGVFDVVHLVAHRTRAHPFEQGGHAGRVTQAGAMVDVVRTKTGAHQFLKQIGLLIGAFGRTKARQGLRAMLGFEATQTTSRQIQGFFPSGRSEHAVPIGGIATERLQLAGVFGRIGTANERHRQALGMVGIVETKTAFHTQAVVVGRAIASLHPHDAFVAHLIGEQTPHPTKRAHRVHFSVDGLIPRQGFGQQSTSGAHLHAFATGHTRALTHGVLGVEHDLAVRASEGVTDHVVHLRFTARAHAAVALNAGVELDQHGRVRRIDCNGFAPNRFQGLAGLNPQAIRPIAELAKGARLWRLRGPLPALVGHVGQQHFEHHALAFGGALRLGVHLHASRGCAAAAGGQHPLAFDFDDTGTAIAIGAQVVVLAQTGHRQTQAIGHLQQGLPRLSPHRLAIEFEFNPSR